MKFDPLGFHSLQIPGVRRHLLLFLEACHGDRLGPEANCRSRAVHSDAATTQDQHAAKRLNEPLQCLKLPHL